MEANKMISLILSLTLLFTTKSDDCQCDISVISASVTYIANTNQNGFVSSSADALAPWNGIPTHFKGINQGGSDIVYEYGITCAVPCWIKNINVYGAAWKNSIITLYDDVTSGVLGTADLNEGNVFKQKILDLSSNEQYLTQFRLRETNQDTNWRYRALFTMTQEAKPECSTQCTCNCNCQFLNDGSIEPDTNSALVNKEISDGVDDYTSDQMAAGNNDTGYSKSTKQIEIVLYGIIVGFIVVIVILIMTCWKYVKVSDKTTKNYDVVDTQDGNHQSKDEEHILKSDNY